MSEPLDAWDKDLLEGLHRYRLGELLDKVESPKDLEGLRIEDPETEVQGVINQKGLIVFFGEEEYPAPAERHRNAKLRIHVLDIPPGQTITRNDAGLYDRFEGMTVNLSNGRRVLIDTEHGCQVDPHPEAFLRRVDSEWC